MCHDLPGVSGFLGERHPSLANMRDVQEVIDQLREISYLAMDHVALARARLAHTDA